MKEKKRSLHTLSSAGPNVPVEKVMSLPITMAERPFGYSGVKKSMCQATMPMEFEPGGLQTS